MLGITRISRTTGFTIVELLIVIIVIGILAGITIVGYNGITSSAREKSLISDADGVAAEITRYATKNNGTYGGAVAWYSGNGANPRINFTPSSGNVVDVAVSLTDYCIRVFNPGTSKNSITSAYEKGYGPLSCTNIAPSTEAGGTWDNPEFDEDVDVPLPIARWKFNGDANDSVGTAHGTVTGAVLTTGQNGQSSGAYSFNGTSDLISLSNTTALQVSGTFTISAWVYATNLSARHGVFSTRTTNPAGAWQLEVGTGSGGTGRVAVSGVGTWLWESNNNQISTNTWYHIVFSKPNNASVGTMYVNGALIAPASTAPYTILNNLDAKQIGAGTLSAQYLGGRIDDVRLYDSSLSAEQVLVLYNAGAQ